MCHLDPMDQNICCPNTPSASIRIYTESPSHIVCETNDTQTAIARIPPKRLQYETAVVEYHGPNRSLAMWSLSAGIRLNKKAVFDRDVQTP